jgi:hypothetical protein
MEFASDRDLAILEPSVYRDVAWQALTLCTGIAQVGDTILEATTADADFTSLPLGAGNVVLIGGFVCEVLSLLDVHVIVVSKLRASSDTPAIPIAALSNSPFVIRSFRPQIAWAHAALMAMAGLKPGEEQKVMNPADACRLEALLALSIVYTGAGALETTAGMYTSRGAMYRRRFMEERGRTMLLIDHDGDGQADEQRLLHAGKMSRG